MQVTIQMLKNKIEYLNELTDSPLTPYSRIDNRNIANIGNFHLYQAYGAFGLHRMVNEGGGVSDSYVYGLHTKRELFERLNSFINGLQFNERG